MPPPFNIDNTSPAPSSLISAFPSNEQANRALIEEWLSYISDPTTGLVRANRIEAGVAFPTGTKMLFQQTAAPTGWVKQSDHNNKALRVVTGTAVSGGSRTFTAALVSGGDGLGGGQVGNTTLTVDQMPAHAHTFTGTTDTGNVGHIHGGIPLSSTTGSGTQTAQQGGTANGGTASTGMSGELHTHTFSGTTASRGGGGSHSHSFTADPINVAYVDVIIAAKS